MLCVCVCARTRACVHMCLCVCAHARVTGGAVRAQVEPGALASWLSIANQTGGVVVMQEGAFPSLTTRVLQRHVRQASMPPDSLLLLPWADSREDYMRRMGCGSSLLLDAPHYSAHTVCVDALWAGTAVVTRPGTRLVSRIAASLLYAAGVHAELVTRDWDDYCTIAARLAACPQRLARLRQRLMARREHLPMFDTLFYKINLVKVSALAFDAHVAAAAHDLGMHTAEGRRRSLHSPHILMRGSGVSG